MIAYLSWLLHRIGYRLRPYDMLADRRRWWWQPRQRCGWSYLRENHTVNKAQRDDIQRLTAVLEEVVPPMVEAMRRMLASWKANEHQLPAVPRGRRRNRLEDRA